MKSLHYELVEQGIEHLRTADSKNEIFGILEAVSLELGFKHFALIHHTDLRKISTETIHIDNYPGVWREYFIEQQLYKIDPVFTACQRTTVGFPWTDAPALTLLSKQQIEILEGSTRHGLGSGYTVPIHVPSEPPGSCSFATRFGVEPKQRNFLAANLFGAFAFQAARRVAGLDAGLRPRKLTPRQRECVLLVAHGKIDWEIGRILGLSEETVTKYLNAARTRYDVSRRMQLVICALFDGQISISEAMGRQ